MNMGANRPNSMAFVGIRHCFPFALLSLLIICINQSINIPTNHCASAAAAVGNRTGIKVNANREKGLDLYIVYMGHHKNRGKDLLVAQHLELLTLVKGSVERATQSIVYHYTYTYSGFAALLTINEADLLSRMDQVVSVLPNEMWKPQTTRSWEFLGLVEGFNNLSTNTFSYRSDLWDLAKHGEDVIIGVIDTGIWPESRSFEDDGMEELAPNVWRGECEVGIDFPESKCNKKIVGARTFRDGLEAVLGPVVRFPIDFESVRDAIGHGTHVASTAAGRIVPKVSGFGPGDVAGGTATGGLPLARLAIYKVCWNNEIDEGEYAISCSSADVNKAIEKAVEDGVHVVSLSIAPPAGHRPFYQQAGAISAFHAIQAGVLVSAAAGNSGPKPGSSQHLAPWILTTAATNTDRSFVARFRLKSGVTVEGQSLTAFNGIQQRAYRLVRGRDVLLPDLPPDIHTEAFERECQLDNTLDPSRVKNAIVYCARGHETHPYFQSLQVKRAGGVAMIYGTNNRNLDSLGIYELPTISLTLDASSTIETYIATTRNPTTMLFPLMTVIPTRPSPTVSVFSSQGPNKVEYSVLKPDISAPGDQILAAWPGSIGPSGSYNDHRTATYNIISGTSMACPHVSAIAALLRSIHPSWSPSAIKSAIMTTASRLNNIGESIKGYVEDSSGTVTMVKASPFLVGAGQINPKRAVDPGLVFDATHDDYIEFLCNIGYNETLLRMMTGSDLEGCPETLGDRHDLNQPYVVVNLRPTRRAVTVVRKVTNVGVDRSTYHAVVRIPRLVDIEIQPETLTFSQFGQTLTFRVRVEIPRLSRDNRGNTYIGSITWVEDEGHHTVRIPIVVGT